MSTLTPTSSDPLLVTLTEQAEGLTRTRTMLIQVMTLDELGREHSAWTLATRQAFITNALRIILRGDPVGEAMIEELVEEFVANGNSYYEQVAAGGDHEVLLEQVVAHRSRLIFRAIAES